MRQLLVGCGVLLIVLAGVASADQPLPEEGTVNGSATLSDVCPFPVSVAYTAQYRAKYFFSRGALTKIEYHMLEQDVFNADGTSLAGVPFRFNVQLFFDGAGNVTRYVAQGVQQKVPLPGGGFFLTAGRVNWQLYPGANYILFPDNGATVNLEGFCAALE